MTHLQRYGCSRAPLHCSLVRFTSESSMLHLARGRTALVASSAAEGPCLLLHCTRCPQGSKRRTAAAQQQHLCRRASLVSYRLARHAHRFCSGESLKVEVHEGAGGRPAEQSVNSLHELPEALCKSQNGHIDPLLSLSHVPSAQYPYTSKCCCNNVI